MRPESPQSPETPPSRPPFRPPSGRAKTFSSLQNHVNYRYLWTGNLFANCAQWLQFITIGWLALDISGSAFHSILTVAVRALPLLILGPWGGVLSRPIGPEKAGHGRASGDGVIGACLWHIAGQRED
ncbi:MAG TPA: hypothetical protein EYM73_10660 [Dehalococcoidia bacterium]|nr:hypothetical protein [Dehalococcoidia bacterium]